jgi:hypothetical protein
VYTSYLSIFITTICHFDESQAPWILFFVSCTIVFSALQKIPGAAIILVYSFQYGKWQFHENLWG